MDFITELLFGSSIGHVILVLAFTIALGVTLERVKFFGISLGMTWVLFVGIITAHFGSQYTTSNEGFINHHILHFVKEFGLVLFVYAIGLQTGPNFMKSFKASGLKMNLLALIAVSLNVIVALIIYFITSLDISAIVGILSGAITNTPGLGAAQAVSAELSNGIANPLIASGYAITYPLGVIGIITSIIIIRFIFNIDLEKEKVRAKIEEDLLNKQENNPITNISEHKELNLAAIFVGILFGIILGSIPIPIYGMPKPVTLGLAGGPLVVSIVMAAWLGKKLHLEANATSSAIMLMREIGIALFLACVGLSAGETFMQTIAENGLSWVGYGVLITMIPLLTIGVIGFRLFKIDYCTLMGLIAGSTTDPPALAYSNDIAKNNKPSNGYATVYPFTMFLRIMTAQLVILLFS